MLTPEEFIYRSHILHLNTEELCIILERNGVGDICHFIRNKQIDGENFLNLSHFQISLWRNELNHEQLNNLQSLIEWANSNVKEFYNAGSAENEISNPRESRGYDDDFDGSDDFDDDGNSVNEQAGYIYKGNVNNNENTGYYIQEHEHSATGYDPNSDYNETAGYHDDENFYGNREIFQKPSIDFQEDVYGNTDIIQQHSINSSEIEQSVIPPGYPSIPKPNIPGISRLEPDSDIPKLGHLYHPNSKLGLPNYPPISKSGSSDYRSIPKPEYSNHSSIPKPGPPSYPSVPKPGRSNFVSFPKPEPLDYPSVPKTERPGYPSIPKPERLDYPSVPKTGRPGYPSISKPEPLNYPSVPKPGRPDYSSIPKPEPLNYPSVSKTGRPDYPSIPKPEPVNYPSVPKTGRPDYPSIPKPEPLNYPSIPKTGRSDYPSILQPEPLDYPSVLKKGYPDHLSIPKPGFPSIPGKSNYDFLHPKSSHSSNPLGFSNNSGNSLFLNKKLPEIPNIEESIQNININSPGEDHKNYPRIQSHKNEQTKTSYELYREKISPNISEKTNEFNNKLDRYVDDRLNNSKIDRTVFPPIPGQTTQQYPPNDGENNETHDEPIGSRTNNDYKKYPWYKEIDREQAAYLLNNKPDGTFIIRPSSQFYCTLTLVYSNKIYNVGIKQDENNLFTVGSLLKIAFSSVYDAIIYYMENEVCLKYQNKDVYTKLKQIS